MKLLSLLSTTYTGLTLYDPADFIDISVPISTTSCSTLTLGNPDVSLLVSDADNYINSLSDEELAAFDEKLSNKNLDLVLNDDAPKVFIKKDNKII